MAKQTFPKTVSHTAHQAEVWAKVGNASDFRAFRNMTAKGTACLNAANDPEQPFTVGGRLLRSKAQDYFTAAQALRMLHHDRSWEDYFPWIVFRNRFLGNKIEWIEWAAKEYGPDYHSFKVNDILKAFHAAKKAAA